MLVEIRTLYNTDRKKERYIRALQDSGRLKKHINKNGYVCYDTLELERYKKKTKRGRPAKY